MVDLGNNRVAYFQTAFFYGDAGTGANNYLSGVQSVDYTRELAPNVISDLGHLNQTYIQYGKTGYSVTVSRLLPIEDTTFFQSPGTTYLTGHLLLANAIGCGGPNNVVKQYDLRIVYGEDVSLIDDSPSYSTLLFKYAVLTGMSYSISVNGSITENLTFFSNQYDQLTTNGTGSPVTPENVVTLKRQHIDIDNCVFPIEVSEAFDTGTTFENKPVFALQNIELNCEIGYRDLPDMGKWRGSVTPSEANLYRLVELPIAVTASFTGLVRTQYFADGAAQNHQVTDTYHTAGTYGSETKLLDKFKMDRRIKIQTFDLGSEFWTWDLASRNYITSFDISGGDTGGGNVEATLSFQNDSSDFFLYQGTTSPNYVSPASPV